jgi:hypothetical protein
LVENRHISNFFLVRYCGEIFEVIIMIQVQETISKSLLILSGFQTL